MQVATTIKKLWTLSACIIVSALLVSCSENEAPVAVSKPQDGVFHEHKEQSPDVNVTSTHEKEHNHSSHSDENTNTESEAMASAADDLDRLNISDLDQTDIDASSDLQTPSNAIAISADSSAGVVRWQKPVNKPYVSAKLTISNKAGETIVRDFTAGEAIELYGDLPDGVYKWESVIAPQIEEWVRDEMQAVRSSGDSFAERELIARFRAEGLIPTEEEARANVQSGSFRVLEGVVRPNYVDDPLSNEDEG